MIDGLTGVQRVLLGWAQVWQAKGRDEEIVRRLAMDPHSPNEFRCNGVVRNVDEFYEAFDVRPGDALYLPPAGAGAHLVTRRAQRSPAQAARALS